VSIIIWVCQDVTLLCIIIGLDRNKQPGDAVELPALSYLLVYPDIHDTMQEYMGNGEARGRQKS